jgi:acyl-homoserine lactone acylase PvdQ
MLHPTTRRTLGFLFLLALAVTLGSFRGADVASADPGAVTVREPAFGIPHIYADTDLELARENGREIAKDRLGQLILFSRVARGTLFQAFGALDPSTFDDDVEVRRSGYTSSELNGIYDKLAPDMKAYTLEYARGVNDTIDAIYAGTLPEPLEVNLLRNALGLGDDLFGNATNISDQVDPFYRAPGGDDPEHPNGGFQFTPELSMAIVTLQIRTFGSEDFDDPSRLDELNGLLDKFGDDGEGIWDDLNFLNDPLAPVTLPDERTPGFGGPLAQQVAPEESPAASAAALPDYDYSAALEPVEESRAHREEFARSLGAWPALGSYAWMIDGDRSATGNPWIGGFPQMGIQTPSIMHMIESRSAEGDDHRIEAMGMELVGTAPAVVIGHTDNVAWSSTTAQLKNNDYYLDRLILEDTDSLRYDDEGTPAAMTVRSERIVGGDGSAIPIVIWRTHEREANGKSNGGTRTVEAFQSDTSGTVESATDTSLTASGAFGEDFAGGYVAITYGTGAGQMRPIASNDADTLTLDAAWTTTPDDTSEYVAATAGNDIVAVSHERVFWLEEMTSALGWTQFQRAESILDIRRGTRMMPSTHNFIAADNQPFNEIGTDLGSGTGNIGYFSGGFSRVRQGSSPTDVRLPMDGSAANELVVVSGEVDSADADSLTSSGAFADEDFAPPPFNYRMNNPDEKGSEYVVAIIAGDGYKQSRRIASNDDDTLTLEEDWGLAPSPGDLFEVYEIVAMPEAINPDTGFSANWNNKAATADDGRDFGRQNRVLFILEQLAANDSWTRDDQHQLNKDVAGLDGWGQFGQFLIPRLREAVDAEGNGGNEQVDTVLADLEAQNESPEFGRHFVDPVTATTSAGEPEFLNELINRLAIAIYGDEFADTGVDVPAAPAPIETPDRFLTVLNMVQHAIDSAAGSPDGRYEQSYGGDYFNGEDWQVVVRDVLSETINDLGGILADSPRPEDNFAHPLSALYENLVFPATPEGNRGTWEQIVEVGPVVQGEFVFPLGQSGFIDADGNPDPNDTSLLSLWGEWRFAPMLHISEDLAADPDGDVDNDGVLDGYERWYFGSNSPDPTDDDDNDGASLLDESLKGLDPTKADTDEDGMPDGFELANACLNAQARDATADPDGDGVDNLAEYKASTDPCEGVATAPSEGVSVEEIPSGGSGGYLNEEQGGGLPDWWYALAAGGVLLVLAGLATGRAARRR